MPIEIVETPEPLSDASRLVTSRPPLTIVESDASRLLVSELGRYCAGEVAGRSFLVAGHRGAGKTMLVAHSLQRVEDTAASGAYPLRPLFVPLHGPSLLPALPDPPAPSRPTRNGRPKPLADPAAGGGADGAAGAHGVEGAEETQNALQQITLGLHRALAREIVRAYRARIAAETQRVRSPRDVRRRERLAELAGQLELELFECPSAARLREFWARPGFLHTGGILRLDPSAGPVPGGLYGRPDQGVRELVALVGVCEAYRRISGTFTQEEKRADADAAHSEWSAGGAAGARDVYGPLLTLLAGGLVGAGVKASADAYTATISGILAALGAATVLRYSGTRTRDRSIQREYSFLFDLRVSTLDRVLPILVERLRDAGLAPVFVVDELDKVGRLSERMIGMVHHLKKFVAESAFFVFITDRSYFESFRRRLVTTPFPVEHTYFSYHLFIVYRPEDLRRWIGTVVRPKGASPQASEEADHSLLPYILLHRARMHPIDLRREIVELRGADGNVRLRTGQVRTSRAYQFDVRVQLAVEMVLAGNDDLATALEQDPNYRRLANDAMYYLSRRWAEFPDLPIDLADTSLTAFRQHLVERMGSDRPGAGADGAAPATPPPLDLDRVPEADARFLLERTREVASLLSDHGRLRDRLQHWNGRRPPGSDQRIPQAVLDALDALPLSPLDAVPGRGHVFEWQFHPTGRARTETARHHCERMTRALDWEASARLVRSVQGALARLTP